MFKINSHDRNRQRFKYTAEVVVESKQKGSIQGVLRDVSIESIYIHVESSFFDVGEPVELRVVLAGSDSQLSITAKGTVVRVDEDGLAVKFTKSLEWWPVFSLFPYHQADVEPNKYLSESEDF